MKTKKKASMEMDFGSLKAEETEILQNKKKMNKLADQEEDYIFWDEEN